MGVETNPGDGNRLQTFIQHCDSGFEETISAKQDALPAPRFGRWVFVSSPSIPLDRELTLAEVRNAIQASIISQSNLPIGDVRFRSDEEMTTHNESGIKTIRAFFSRPTFPYVDYWVADTKGQFYATRSYYEDVVEFIRNKEGIPLEWDVSKTRAFFAKLHVSDFAEFLAHSLRYCQELSKLSFQIPHITVHASFRDLANRSILDHRPVWGFRKYSHTSNSPEWAIEREINSGLPEDNIPDLLPSFFSELWESVFNFYKPFDGFYTHAYEKAMGMRRD